MTTETKEQPTETALTLKHAMLSTVFEKTDATRFLELIDKEVINEVCDVTTRKGRDRERSLAAGISSFKVHIRVLALKSIEEQKDIVKGMKDYLDDFCDKCDEFRDKRKAPALKWSADEEERKEGHRNKIEVIKAFGENLHDVVSVSIAIILEDLGKLDISGMQEFAVEAELAKKETIEIVKAALDAANKYEASQAKLKRLQEEAEKRKADDAKRLEEEERLKAEAARIEAEKAELKWAKEQADADKKAAEEAEKQRQIDENKRIQDAEDQARIDERKRLFDIQLKKDMEAKLVADLAETKRIADENADLKRQADKGHRAKVREYAAADMDPFVSDGFMVNLIAAMEKGDIRGVTMNF